MIVRSTKMEKVKSSELQKLRSIHNTTIIHLMNKNREMVEVGRRKLLHYQKLVLRRHHLSDKTHTVDVNTGNIVALQQLKNQKQ